MTGAKATGANPIIDRQYRLYGRPDDGSDKGGGLPLTHAFRSVLEYLFDHKDGKVQLSDLVPHVEQACLKRERVEGVVYEDKEGDRYAHFVKDIVDELATRHFTAIKGKKVELGSAFKANQPLAVDEKVTLTIRSIQERKNESAAFHERLGSTKAQEEYKVHPIAALFPMWPDDELKGLAAQIRAKGLKEPITRMKDPEGGDLLLDGRNRLKA
jgi:hypothetical protein